MADGNEYTVSDVVTLIAASGSEAKESSIRAQFSTLKNKEKWFIERKVKAHADQKLSFYKLKANLCYPGKDILMSELCKEQQFKEQHMTDKHARVDVQSTQIPTASDTAPEKSSQTQSDIASTKPTVEFNNPYPLIKANIELKGIAFSITEVLEVVAMGKELYNQSQNVSIPSFMQVKQTFMIKGKEFTTEEIIRISEVFCP